MPSASLSVNMNNLVRDNYQANGLIRSLHQQSMMASSQTSLQKIPSSSPQFLHYTNNDANQQTQQQQSKQQQQQQQHNQANQQHMQFPPPPPMAPLVPQANHMPKSDQSISSLNSFIVPQSQQQQAQSIAINQNSTIMPQLPNGINGANNPHSQTTMLMSPMMANKNTRNNQAQYIHHQLQQQQQAATQQPPQLQHQHYQLQHQHPVISNPQQLVQMATAAANPISQQQQQVPMTTIMIPATAAAQIQSASIQIQQAAMQSMANNSGQPQILVFMIPYMVNQPPPTIPPTPEQASLNSTLVRQSHSTASLLRSSTEQHLQHHLQQQQQQQQQQQLQLHYQQQQQQQPPQHHQVSSHSRAVSSLSNSKQQDSEKFYIKANFSYQNTRNKMELSFQRGDILHVLDTLQNSDYGLQYWLATKVKSNGKDAEKGLIPDKNKAEEIALEQRTLEMNHHSSALDGNSGSVLSASVGRVNFLKRRAAQRSKSLCKDGWDNVVFDIGSFKLPTYERVVYKHPGFCRPVVIFGPLADVAREKLLKDYPEKYSYPTGFHQSQDHPKVIRLKGIYEVIDQGKHALLDITPSAVEKLNYVSLAPIVIFMKTDSKSIIKEFRSRAAKSLDQNASSRDSQQEQQDTLRRDGKSNRKLLEQSIKLEKTWFHVFTATLNLSTMGSEMWYRKLRETIENQQSANVWMSEKKSDKKMAAAVGATTTNSSVANTAISSNNTATNINNNNNATTNDNANMVFPNSTTTTSSIANNSFSQNANEILFTMPSTQTSTSCLDKSSSVLSERFSESLNITSKSTIDLLPDKTYGNRSQLRNAYAHSLAQKLARASSEPKLNGLLSDDDDDDIDQDDDDDDDDDDDIIKKPLPYEYENSSSISSSNGATSYGQGSMTGTSMTYQHYPPPQLTGIGKTGDQQQQQLHSLNNDNTNSNNNSRATIASQQEGIYSRNPIVNNSFGNGNNGGAGGGGSNYHPLPPMPITSDNGYHHNQNHNSMTNINGSNGGVGGANSSSNTSNGNNNVVDLSRNHETRGSAFQVYSDINQNNYHYYNINKIL